MSLPSPNPADYAQVFEKLSLDNAYEAGTRGDSEELAELLAEISAKAPFETAQELYPRVIHQALLGAHSRDHNEMIQEVVEDYNYDDPDLLYQAAEEDDLRLVLILAPQASEEEIMELLAHLRSGGRSEDTEITEYLESLIE